MKIRIEITEEPEEIVIRTHELNDTIMKIQKAVQNITSEESKFAFYKGDTQYYLNLNEILFFETSDSTVSAHTAKDVFETKYKLYELEEMLPKYFMRVSKSTILNIRHIYSITKNITASSTVEFKGTYKKVYVSRNYYKLLTEKIEEMRTK